MSNRVKVIARKTVFSGGAGKLAPLSKQFIREIRFPKVKKA